MPDPIGGYDVGGSAVPPPARRAELAHARADELRLRRTELASGALVTSDAAALARRRAEEAGERAAAAWRTAFHRHVESQRSHLRAAAAHEQAAMTVGDDECDVHQSAAERHRAAAAVHGDTVGRLSASGPPGVTSLGILHQQ